MQTFEPVIRVSEKDAEPGPGRKAVDLAGTVGYVRARLGTRWGVPSRLDRPPRKCGRHESSCSRISAGINQGLTETHLSDPFHLLIRAMPFVPDDARMLERPDRRRERPVQRRGHSAELDGR